MSFRPGTASVSAPVAAALMRSKLSMGLSYFSIICGLNCWSLLNSHNAVLNYENSKSLLDVPTLLRVAEIEAVELLGKTLSIKVLGSAFMDSGTRLLF